MSTQTLTISNANASATPTQGGVIVTITNNLKIPVDIYDVFNPGSKTQVLPFTYTKLGTIAAGATGKITTIRNVAQLQAMYTGAIAELSNNYYYQFPIKFMSGTQLNYGTPPPLTYAIEEADRTATVQSFLFYKFAMANPGSALTTSFNAQIKSGKPDDINAFFKGTKNFQQCTFAAWNAVLTWLQQFTSGWQGPYYLYQKAPAQPPKDYVPKLIATLNIVSDEKNNSAIMKSCGADDKGNPVYTNPPEITNIEMVGDGTMSDSSTGADTTVSLTPVWMNVVQTKMVDNVPVSNYLIGSAVCGTVAGIEVVSSQTARQIPDKPEDKSKAATFDSIFGKLCQTVGLLVGFIMLYEFITKKANGSNEAKEEARSEADNDEDLSEEFENIDNEFSSDVAENFGSASAEEVLRSADTIQESYAEATAEMQREVMTEAMDAQEEMIQNEISEQLNDGVTPTQEFENAFSDMETSFDNARSSISDGDFSSASETLSKASSDIETVIKEQGDNLAEWESSALSDSSDALSDATDANDALNEAQEQYEEDIQNEAEDSGYEADTEDPEVDPIEEF